MFSKSTLLAILTLGFTITSVEAAQYGGKHFRYCFKAGWPLDPDCGIVKDPRYGKTYGIRWMEEEGGKCYTYSAYDISDILKKGDPNPYNRRYLDQIDFSKADQLKCKLHDRIG